MSARHEYDPRSEFQPIGRCPRCRGPIQRGDLLHDGLLRTRAASRGGPYYLLSCSNCGERIVIERSSPTAAYVLRSEKDLPTTSPLRRILVEFLGGSSRSRRESKRSPRRHQPQPKTPSPGPPPHPRQRVWTDAQRVALETLGLNEAATLVSIKDAYRSLARALHPDAHPYATEEQRAEWSSRFAKASDAYRLLTRRTSMS
ncbi:MAG: J domain-containing protein [Planctomycetes bacterium]|nr:J domain-containing protein [Planctomycetota bacterium]MCC7172616.1 J domain-containing protein [Planctomycetota bacterium]